jgi:hypothetical protein
MNSTRTYRFRLSITREEYLSYYAGTARWVVARAYEGEAVQFPASFLRRFVQEDGVFGTFEMTVDDDNRLVSMRRIDARGRTGPFTP